MFRDLLAAPTFDTYSGFNTSNSRDDIITAHHGPAAKEAGQRHRRLTIISSRDRFRGEGSLRNPDPLFRVAPWPPGLPE